MPQSKKRDAHKHPHQDYIPHVKKENKGSAKPAAIIFCCFIALIIAWFAVGEASWWLLLAAAVGSGFGYFLGSQMDKSFRK